MLLSHSPIICECNATLFLADIPNHRAKQCPERIILCRFCHLNVKAGLPSTSAKDILLGGMSEHESECGGRTIQCVKCSQNVQLKDIQVHAQVCIMCLITIEVSHIIKKTSFTIFKNKISLHRRFVKIHNVPILSLHNSKMT